MRADQAPPGAWAPPAPEAARLRALLAAAAAREPATDWTAVPERVRALAGAAARAVVGYGSWYTSGLRKPTSFADVYLVVDDYAAFHRRPLHAWMNRTLPPNVYFLWSDGDGARRIEGKYNVIDVADAERECSPAMRDLYTAGRWTKLVWIAWTRDAATQAWLVERLLAAYAALTPVALAFVPALVTRDAFSLQLLGLSYRGEARFEGWERVRALYEAHAARYRELHDVLLRAFAASTGLLAPEGDAYRRRDAAAWTVIDRAARRLVRRSRRRGYLRWPRIVVTEPNLADLAADEALRKAGVHVPVTPRLRRHPLLLGLPAFLRVLRERRRGERIR